MGIKKIIEKWKGKPVREVLRELYIDEDMTMRQVAKELGISLGEVHKLISEYKINKINK